MFIWYVSDLTLKPHVTYNFHVKVWYDDTNFAIYISDGVQTDATAPELSISRWHVLLYLTSSDCFCCIWPQVTYFVVFDLRWLVLLYLTLDDMYFCTWYQMTCFCCIWPLFFHVMAIQISVLAFVNTGSCLYLALEAWFHTLYIEKECRARHHMIINII